MEMQTAMPPLRVTGFRITRTLDRLVYDLLPMLRDTLSDPAVDLPHNQQDVEMLEFRVLALLSQPLYVKRLLRRDHKKSSAENWHPVRTAWGTDLRIHDEAIHYFYKVLRRRLGLAQNLMDRPTNMHLLLQAGCRFGPAEQGWPSTTIKRDRARSPRHPKAAAFQRAGEILERQHRERANQDADTDAGIAARRRAEYGPLWLIVADWAAEIVAELSLFHDVLRALPAPLPAEFAEDAEFQKRLQRVLESLNERYGLLRSCGLDPHLWSDSEALSVNVLEDLKKLRCGVTARLKAQPDEKRPIAYETCFNALKDDALKDGKAKFAGCKTFSEFLETEVGALLVWGGHAPLPPDKPAPGGRKSEDDDSDEPTPGGGEPEDDDESGAARDFDPDDVGAEPTGEEADRYIARCPELAHDALMSAVVRVAFAGRALDEPEILAELRRLIDRNDLHKKKFGALSDRALAKALCDQAQQIVQRHRQRINRKSSS